MEQWQVASLVHGNKRKIGWRKERDNLDLMAARRQIKIKEERVGTLLDISLDLIEKGLTSVAESFDRRREEYLEELKEPRYTEAGVLIKPKEPIKIDEVEKVVKIAAKLFEMKRVEEGNPVSTSTINVNVTAGNIIKRLVDADEFGFGDVIDVTPLHERPKVEINREGFKGMKVSGMEMEGKYGRTGQNYGGKGEVEGEPDPKAQYWPSEEDLPEMSGETL